LLDLDSGCRDLAVAEFDRSLVVVVIVPLRIPRGARLDRFRHEPGHAGKLGDF
jgi:hypothetical protein